MSTEPTDPLSLLRSIIVGLFPWLAPVRTASDKGLSIKTAESLLHLEGDAGDPAVSRVGDLVVRLYRDTVTGILYVSGSKVAPFAWAPVASGIIPPTPADAGTEVRIVEGSGKVTAAT